jgi:hypothetical protein
VPRRCTCRVLFYCNCLSSPSKDCFSFLGRGGE